MTMEEGDRKRILAGVKQWFRRRKMKGSEAKRLEVAALVAESGALALEGIAQAGIRFKRRIERFRKLAAQFRKDAEEAKRKESTL